MSLFSFTVVHYFGVENDPGDHLDTLVSRMFSSLSNWKMSEVSVEGEGRPGRCGWWWVIWT